MRKKGTDAGRCLRAGLTGILALMMLPVLAASPRLDDANAHLVKAAALLRAAGYKGESQIARMHREQALRLIERAEGQIARSKQAAAKGGTTSVLRTAPSNGNSGPGFQHKLK